MNGKRIQMLRRHLLFSGGLILIVMLTLAACGGKASTSSIGSAPPAPAPTPTAAPEPTPTLPPPPAPYPVPAGAALHVDAATGADTNTGGEADPFATIQAAMTSAGTGPMNIFVAAGTYTVNPTVGHILLVEGVSLYGGFPAGDWTVRDPNVNVTTIQETVMTPGTGAYYTGPIESPAGITNATVVDGFNLLGFTGGAGTIYMSAFIVRTGSAPIIRNNTITSGCGTSGTNGARAIMNEGGSPFIENNTLYTRNSTAACSAGSVAGYMDEVGSTGSPTFIGNTIEPLGPNAPINPTISAEFFGIAVQAAANTVIQGNTIFMRAATSVTTGIRLRNGSSQPNRADLVENNTITQAIRGTSQYGVDVNYGTTNASATLRGNTIDIGGTTGLGAFIRGIYFTSVNGAMVVDANTLTTGVANGNIFGVYFSVVTGAVSVTNNTVNTGTSAGLNNGISVSGSTNTLAITDNRVSAGPSSATVNNQGISVAASTGSLTHLARNIISASTGLSSIGLLVTSTTNTVSVENNVIYGGDGGASGSSTGIRVAEPTTGTLTTLSLYNNTIHGGGSPLTTIGLDIGNTNGFITTLNAVNNIITGGAGTATTSYCINLVGTGFTTVSTNNLTGCATAAYFNNGAADTTIMTGLGNIAVPNSFVSEAGADGLIGTMADNNWRLSAGSDALLRTGGTDLSATFTDDLTGAARSAPWSMGAYEF